VRSGDGSWGSASERHGPPLRSVSCFGISCRARPDVAPPSVRTDVNVIDSKADSRRFKDGLKGGIKQAADEKARLIAHHRDRYTPLAGHRGRNYEVSTGHSFFSITSRTLLPHAARSQTQSRGDLDVDSTTPSKTWASPGEAFHSALGDNRASCAPAYFLMPMMKRWRGGRRFSGAPPPSSTLGRTRLVAIFSRTVHDFFEARPGARGTSICACFTEGEPSKIGRCQGLRGALGGCSATAAKKMLPAQGCCDRHCRLRRGTSAPWEALAISAHRRSHHRSADDWPPKRSSFPASDISIRARR